MCGLNTRVDSSQLLKSHLSNRINQKRFIYPYSNSRTHQHYVDFWALFSGLLKNGLKDWIAFGHLDRFQEELYAKTCMLSFVVICYMLHSSLEDRRVYWWYEFDLWLIVVFSLFLSLQVMEDIATLCICI